MYMYVYIYIYIYIYIYTYIYIYIYILNLKRLLVWYILINTYTERCMYKQTARTGQ